MPNLATKGQLLAGDIIISDDNSDAGAKVARVAKVSMTSATGAGGALSWGNPTDGRIIVTSLVIDITTASGATTTIDAGVAANGTTSSDLLIDGHSTATAGTINSANHNGTNGEMARAVTSSQFVTGSITGTIGSFAGVAYITYVPV